MKRTIKKALITTQILIILFACIAPYIALADTNNYEITSLTKKNVNVVKDSNNLVTDVYDINSTTSTKKVGYILNNQANSNSSIEWNGLTNSGYYTYGTYGSVYANNWSDSTSCADEDYEIKPTCADGYTLNQTTAICEKVTTQTSTADKTCTDGYTLVNNTCTKTYTDEFDATCSGAVINGTCYTLTYRINNIQTFGPNRFSCTSTNTNYGNICTRGTTTYVGCSNRTCTYVATTGTYTCSSGTLNGNKCTLEKTDTKELECPTGYTEIDGICTKQTSTTDQKASTCPSGYTKNNNGMCIKNTCNNYGSSRKFGQSGDVEIRKTVYMTADTAKTGTYKVTFDARAKDYDAPVPYVTIVVDNSSSMNGDWVNSTTLKNACVNNKLSGLTGSDAQYNGKECKKNDSSYVYVYNRDKFNNSISAINEITNNLIDNFSNSQVALISFSKNSSIIRGYDHSKLNLNETGSSNRVAIPIDEQSSDDGGTNMYAGLNAAYNLYNSLSDSEKENAIQYVILISDGDPTINVGKEVTEANNLKNAGATIFTLGYETDSSSSVLPNIASTDENGNAYVYEASVDSVISKLNIISQKIIELTALNVTDGITPIFNKTTNEENNKYTTFNVDESTAVINNNVILTEEWQTLGEFYIYIDPESADGWYATNDNFSFSYYNPKSDNKKETITCTDNPLVYWEQAKYELDIEKNVELLDGSTSTIDKNTEYTFNIKIENAKNLGNTLEFISSINRGNASGTKLIEATDENKNIYKTGTKDICYKNTPSGSSDYIEVSCNESYDSKESYYEVPYYTITLDNNSSGDFTLKKDEIIRFNIPSSTYTITETNSDSYIVTNKIDDEDEIENVTATGTLNKSNIKDYVLYINLVGYILPSVGSSAGLILQIVAISFIAYPIIYISYDYYRKRWLS